MALSHSSRATHLVLSFYLLLSFCFTFVSSLCYFVLSFSSARFVVLHRKQGREPRGALSFALKRETAADSSNGLYLNIVKIHLPVRVRAPPLLTTKRE